MSPDPPLLLCCILSALFMFLLILLEISQTSHHLSSSSNLSLHSCLLPLYHNKLPFASVLCSFFIDGFDVTPYFSSNCFSLDFSSFCFRTAAFVIIIMAFSGSPTPEFCWVYHGLLWFPISEFCWVNSLGSWDTSVPNNTSTSKPTPEFFWVNSSGSWDTSVPNNTPQVSDLTKQPQLLLVSLDFHVHLCQRVRHACAQRTTVALSSRNSSSGTTFRWTRVLEQPVSRPPPLFP